MSDETIGRALRTRRAQLGFDQREAALRIGMSRTTFSSYERDTQRPSVDVLPAIAAFLDVSIDDVLVLFGASAIAAARTALGHLNDTASATLAHPDTDVHTADTNSHAEPVSATDEFTDLSAGHDGGDRRDDVEDLSPYSPAVSIGATPAPPVRAHDERSKGKKKKKKKAKRQKLVSPAFATHV